MSKMYVFLQKAKVKKISAHWALFWPQIPKIVKESSSLDQKQYKSCSLGNLFNNLNIWCSVTFLEWTDFIDYHYGQIIVMIQRFKPLRFIFSQKIEKNSCNNCLRVEMTTDHTKLYINGLSGQIK